MERTAENVTWALKKESTCGKWKGGETQGALCLRKEASLTKAERWGHRAGLGHPK